MNNDLTNYQDSNEESGITEQNHNVVTELCFVAWVAQACSKLRGAPTKEQALTMVEEYFEGVKVTSSNTPKVKKVSAKKHSPEREQFMQWVSDQMLARENRELTIKEASKFQGVYDYYKKFGPQAPYESAFKVKEEKKVNHKAEVYREWLAKNERAKGEPLTHEETATLRNKWYSRPHKDEGPAVWDNRGRWPVCSLHQYESATAIRVKLDGAFIDLAIYRDGDAAKDMLANVDNWLVSLRHGRSPADVMGEVANNMITTPQ